MSLFSVSASEQHPAATGGRVAVLCMLAFAAGGLSAETSTGAAVYQALEGAGVLEDYAKDLVWETATTLAHFSGRWPRAQVNGRYLPGSVNVYLIDGDRLPSGNILADQGVSLAGRRFSRAVVDEATGIIFVDTRFLKEFVAYRMLVDRGDEGLRALARVRVEGLAALRDLWDPARNPDLRSRLYGDKWLLAFRGMLGFVLGHELGHIALGERTIGLDEPVEFERKEDLDFRWACPELTDSGHWEKQQVESQADDFGVSLISQVLFPFSLIQNRLLYEIGAHQYLSYELKGQQLEALLATTRPAIHLAVRTELGDALYAAVLELGVQADRGGVHIFYPRSHPATLARVSQSLGKLSRSPYSSFPGGPPGGAADLFLLEQTVSQECARLRSLRTDALD